MRPYFVFAINCFWFLTRAAILKSFSSRHSICLIRAISKSTLFFTLFHKIIFQVRILISINRMPKSLYINLNKVLPIIILIEVHFIYNIDGSKLTQSPRPLFISLLSAFITILWPYSTKLFIKGLYIDIYIFLTPCFFRSLVIFFLFLNPLLIVIDPKILCLQKISLWINLVIIFKLFFAMAFVFTQPLKYSFAYMMKYFSLQVGILITFKYTFAQRLFVKVEYIRSIGAFGFFN